MSTEPLECRYVRLSRIPVNDVSRMFEIFRGYYANAHLDVFLRDLGGKSGAFIVRRRRDGGIVGFSTVRTFHMDVDGRRALGIFSGDTLIERAYWGDSALQLAFSRYVFAQRLRNPFTPLYWCLISKGYKTYLLLANNFPRYFPHPQGDNASLQAVARAYCRQLFPGHLDEQAMVLRFGAGAQHLHADVAAITDELRVQQPRIAFFEQCNPGWAAGDELPCVGMLGWRDFLVFARADLRKLLRRRGGRRELAAAPAVAPAIALDNLRDAA